MSCIRLFVLLTVFLLPTLTACSHDERVAWGYALQNYGSHSTSSAVYCKTTKWGHGARATYTASCY
jgi:hypothetical protein